MKNVVALAVSALVLTLTVSAFDCGNGTTPPPNPTPVPNPTKTPTPAAIIVPELDPPLPKVIGYTQVGDMKDAIDRPGYNFQSNEDTADEMVANGFQAVHLWPHESVQSLDIRKVICNPAIKLLVIRPMARVGRDADNCKDANGYAGVWENADFGQMAWDLLEDHGDLACRGGEPLDIILNNWEGDWQAKGAHCRFRVPSERRWYRMKAELEMAQMGVMWARGEHPDAALRVLFGMTTNHRVDEKYEWTLIRDGFADLDPRWWPDLMSISTYGDGGEETPQMIVDTIQRYTGYPLSRMYVAETGVNEKWMGRQRDHLSARLPLIKATGIRVIFVWTWKQYWPGILREDGSRLGGWFGNWEVDENLGLPIQDSFTGRWTSGLEYVQEFRMNFDESPLPAVTPPVGDRTPVPTPTPPDRTPTPVPPTETPKPPPTGTPEVPTHTPVPPTATPVPPTGTPVPPTETPVDTPTPPVATETPIPPPVYTFTPTPDPCDDCPVPGTIWCDMYPVECAACWEECGQPTPTPGPPTATPPPPTSTPTPGGPTATPAITPTPVPGDCDGCPAPGTIGCEISYPACEQCWEECGEPLPTRTPTPIPTITPTPTPPYSDNPTFTVVAEDTPVHCSWVFTHEGGTIITKEVPGCVEMNQQFGIVGWWTVESTTHFDHGAVGIHTKPNGDKYGDLDGDGKYEYWHSQLLEVLPKPDAPIYT